MLSSEEFPTGPLDGVLHMEKVKKASIHYITFSILQGVILSVVDLSSSTSSLTTIFILNGSSRSFKSLHNTMIFTISMFSVCFCCYSCHHCIRCYSREMSVFCLFCLFNHFDWLGLPTGVSLGMGWVRLAGSDRFLL